MSRNSKSRATKRRGRSNVIDFNPKYEQEAVTQGPQLRKNFGVKDLTQIVPKTEHQEDVFHVWNEDYSCVRLMGCAGTGKTFLAMFLALRDLLGGDEGYEKIVIIRSAVQGREIGHLPGTAEEKLQEFEAPYISICDELFPWKKSYENLKKLGKIEFHSTSFLRGKTFNDALIVVDENQNLTGEEASTIITRVGQNSRIIFCGDTKQNDLYRKKNDMSGMEDFNRILDNMKEVATVEFGPADIVRSGLARSFLTQAHLLGL